MAAVDEVWEVMEPCTEAEAATMVAAQEALMEGVEDEAAEEGGSSPLARRTLNTQRNRSRRKPYPACDRTQRDTRET